MLRTCVILGLALLVIGGLAFGWTYSETQAERERGIGLQGSLGADSLGAEAYLEKYGRWYELSPEQQNQLALELDKDRQSKTQEQLAREQQARLQADLDKLAAGEMDPGDIADFLYGSGWEGEVEQYKKRKEQMEIAQTTSIVCLSIGGVLFSGCIAAWLLGLFVRLIRAVKERSRRGPSEPEPDVPELTDIEPHGEDDPEEPKDSEPPLERPKQRRKVLAVSETPSGPYASGPIPEESTIMDGFRIPSPGRSTTTGRLSLAAEPADEDSSVAVLLADEPSQETEWSPEAQWSLQGVAATSSENLPSPYESVEQPAASTLDQGDRAGAAEDPLKGQAEDLQKQITEFKQAAQDVQQAAREQSEPLSSTLKELAQQVSAIREYAANQQGRVEKLQDGYDWGIIRTFCLRVIRCLDNLENRIAELPEGDGALDHLEEVRDELLFALESSGVEQFRPEVNSEYKGLERSTETIKERQSTKKREMVGKIAKVIRPGYRYMVDDESFKIVRTAQVKLFG